LGLYAVFTEYDTNFFFTDQMDAVVEKNFSDSEIDLVLAGFTIRDWICESKEGPSGTMKISPKGLTALRDAKLIPEGTRPQTQKSGESIPSVALIGAVASTIIGSSRQPISHSIENEAVTIDSMSLLEQFKFLKKKSESYNEAVQEKSNLTAKLGSLKGDLATKNAELERIKREYEERVARLNASIGELSTQQVQASSRLSELETVITDPDLNRFLSLYAEIKKELR
jgi:hypothetical protein